MKTKLFVFLILFSIHTMGYTAQRYLLTSSDLTPIWLEVSDDYSYTLVDKNKSYKLLQRKEYIFEGAHLLQALPKAQKMALLMGFKTIAKSRDLRLSAYEFVIDDKGILSKDPKKTGLS